MQIKHIILFKVLFVAVYEFHKSDMFQVLPHYRYVDWLEHKVITPLSAQHGWKPEDTQANQCISAKLHAFYDPAKSEPPIKQPSEAKIKPFFSFGLSTFPPLPCQDSSPYHAYIYWRSAEHHANKNEFNPSELRAFGSMRVN